MAVIRVYGFCEEGKGLRVLQQLLFVCWDLLGDLGGSESNSSRVGFV